MRRVGSTPRALVLAAAVLIAATALAGEPDWFTRVREKGLAKASAEEVERHAKGVLEDSLHVGECYYHLERWEEGVRVFGRLLRSPDRNYAAAAMARVGEGQFHLGKTSEARATFLKCIEEHPEAWLDGSVPERCRAWIAKLEGRLSVPLPDAGERAASPSLADLARDVRELDARLAELRALLEKLAGE